MTFLDQFTKKLAVEYDKDMDYVLARNLYKMDKYNKAYEKIRLYEKNQKESFQEKRVQTDFNRLKGKLLLKTIDEMRGKQQDLVSEDKLKILKCLDEC